MEQVGGGGEIDITKYTFDLEHANGSPGGYLDASWVFNRKLTALSESYGPYSPITIVDTADGEPIWEGHLEDPGRYAGEDGEAFRMHALGGCSSTEDIERPHVGIDSAVDSWGRGLAPWMREEVNVDADENDGVTGPGVMMVAPSGTLITAAQGIGYIHYLPMMQSRQLIGSVMTIDIESGQDAGFRVGHVFGLDEFAGVYNASHVAAPVPTSGVMLSGVQFGFANTCALAWDRTGPDVVAGDACWTRWGGFRVKPILVDRDGDLVVSPPTGWTTWREQVGDMLGSDWLTMVDGPASYLDDDFDGPAPVQIKHLIYPDGVTAAGRLADLLQKEPWATWHIWGRTGAGKYYFEVVPKPTQIAYECDTAYEGLDCPGSTAELWNTVWVRGRDPLGNIASVRVTGGPAPILAAAGVDREKIIDQGDNTFTVGEALATGNAFLTYHARPIRSGTATVSRSLYNELTDEWVKPHRLRAPFRARFSGAIAGSPGTTPDGASVFDVVSVRYSTTNARATLTLDQQPWVRWDDLVKARRR